MIPEIDIWRAATLMLNRYGDSALAQSSARADEPRELAVASRYVGRSILVAPGGTRGGRMPWISIAGPSMSSSRRAKAKSFPARIGVTERTMIETHVVAVFLGAYIIHVETCGRE